MILINLSHPLTEAQTQQIEALAQQPIQRIVGQMAYFDGEQPFAPQIKQLVDDLGLTPTAWQQEPLLLIPPGLNFGTAALIAELHGRCGYFVPLVRIRPVKDSLPPRYEVAEIMNLKAIRDKARMGRG